jgi:hypothetical protein
VFGFSVFGGVDLLGLTAKVELYQKTKFLLPLVLVYKREVYIFIHIYTYIFIEETTRFKNSE